MRSAVLQAAAGSALCKEAAAVALRHAYLVRQADCPAPGRRFQDRRGRQHSQGPVDWAQPALFCHGREVMGVRARRRRRRRRRHQARPQEGGQGAGVAPRGGWRGGALPPGGLERRGGGDRRAGRQDGALLLLPQVGAQQGGVGGHRQAPGRRGALLPLHPESNTMPRHCMSGHAQLQEAGPRLGWPPQALKRKHQQAHLPLCPRPPMSPAAPAEAPAARARRWRRTTTAA